MSVRPTAALDCWGFSLVYVGDEHVRILTSGLRDGLHLDEVNWSRRESDRILHLFYSSDSFVFDKYVSN